MKKKIALLLVGLVCMLCCALGLAACNNGDNGDNGDRSHDHEGTETGGNDSEHAWGAWEITAENMPTEDTDGKATRNCNDCDAVDTVVLTVPKLFVDGAINPVYDYWVADNSADCENEGTATYTYVNVEYSVSLDFTGKTPALGHDWGARDFDDDNHYITCTRNGEHIKSGSQQEHTKQTTETASLLYNKQTGKWEHMYHTTCEDECGYKKDFKGTEADLNNGGEGASLSAANTTVVGSGTFASPFTVLANNTREYTVTIPANTVISLRYTDNHAMGIYAVAVTEGDNLSVIYGERVVAVAAGERAKSDAYLGESGNSLDFALTTTDREAATIKFRFFNNDNYSVSGNPASVTVDTEYTDEVPLETDIVHTFDPAGDGRYTFTVTGGEITLENGRDLISAGSSFTEPLYFGKSYKITVYTGFERNAGTVKFEIVRAGDIPEPAEGSLSKPQAITEAGEYEINGARFFAFTPAQSGFYVFFDTNSSDATYALYSDSEFATQLTDSIHFVNKKAYSYIEYELTAGTTYYLYAGAGNSGSVTMTISRHEHEFDTEHWQSDANSHWHVSTCGHDVKGGTDGHDYDGNNICTVCSYEKVEMVTEGLLFELSGDGTYYIVSAGTIADDVTEVYIPSTYGESGNKLPVKEIAASGFLNKANIVSVSIPASITKIGANAFQNCTSITSVYITDLAAWASIDFGNTASNPFFAYVNLEGMRSNDTAIYVNGAPLVSVVLNVSVSSYAFMNCASVTTVNLTGASVGTYAFAYCNNLQTLSLNEGVETLEANAFMCCAQITELTFPATLTNIGSGAFGAKTSNPKIDGPAISKLTVADLAAYLQTDWSSALLASGGKIYVGQNEVTSIHAAELGITKIGAYALQNSSVASIDLTGVTSIGISAFRNCSALTTVIIGEGVTSIGAQTFNGCSSLTTLVLPKSLATLTNTALNGCSSLTKIYFLGTNEADLADGETAKAWTTVSNVKSKTIYFYSENAPTTEGNFWHYAEGVPTEYPAI